MNEGFLKFLEKGRNERIVSIGYNAQKALQRYLFRYRPELINMKIDRAFLSTYGSPLTENSLKLMFARLVNRTAMYQLYTHLCRRTFVTRFLINGRDVFILQQNLGYSTPEVVMRYINLATNHISIRHQRFSVLDRLNPIK